MTPDGNQGQPMPQNTVVVNGAAMNFMATLTNGLREDMRAMETRLREDFRARFSEHSEVHEVLELDLTDRRRRVNERLAELEQDDRDDDQAAELVKARRQGRLDVVVWIRDNRAWLAPTLLAAGAFLMGVATGTTT